MKFADFVSREAICANMSAQDKDPAIREMASALKEAGTIPEEHFDGIIEAILKREELGSTGIGRGVAVPHTKHPSVDKIVATVAVSKSGVEFDALDGEKVYLLFLLISPPDRPGDHLRALENISRQLRNDTFCNFLKQCNTADEVWQLLQEADEGKYGS